jgi:hypothetical protein
MAITMCRSAGYSSTLRFYEVLDRNGSVQDPASGTRLSPSSPGYRQAVLSAPNLLSVAGSRLSAADGKVASFSFQVTGGKLFAPVLMVQDTQQTFFSYGAANSDGLSHFDGIGPNAYGI